MTCRSVVSRSSPHRRAKSADSTYVWGRGADCHTRVALVSVEPSLYTAKHFRLHKPGVKSGTKLWQELRYGRAPGHPPAAHPRGSPNAPREPRGAQAPTGAEPHPQLSACWSLPKGRSHHSTMSGTETFATRLCDSPHGVLRPQMTSIGEVRAGQRGHGCLNISVCVSPLSLETGRSERISELSQAVLEL